MNRDFTAGALLVAGAESCTVAELSVTGVAGPVATVLAFSVAGGGPDGAAAWSTTVPTQSGHVAEIRKVRTLFASATEAMERCGGSDGRSMRSD
jgi:hypothetical protein